MKLPSGLALVLQEELVSVKKCNELLLKVVETGRDVHFHKDRMISTQKYLIEAQKAENDKCKEIVKKQRSLLGDYKEKIESQKEAIKNLRAELSK